MVNEIENKVSEQDINSLAVFLTNAIIINPQTALTPNNNVFVSITLLSHFLEDYFELNSFSSNEEKLKMIELLDKLNQQRDLVKSLTPGFNPEEANKAAKRLGRKAQSSFLTK